MQKPFTPEDVAAHRQAYKVILADARQFVNTTVLSQFTRKAYREHLLEIVERLGGQLHSLLRKDECQPPSKKTSNKSLNE